ncbi:COA8 family protein Y39B6A.34, mitochondrial [Halyomorpha halys]|uniref:COA8 family protein Y39B6A.34, mitochondrial n=1 Tax=Halyomorpha halys TaxID=286706 RepID=UPI0006D4F8C6|nr:APOPT family protein CG14806, mitochondrial [Halyomorpha halys]
MEAIKSRLIHRVVTSTNKTFKAVHSSKILPPIGVSVGGDIVGQPDPISNLRPITFHIPLDETYIERKFRLKREHVHNWNEEFWKHHNMRFTLERKEYVEAMKEKKADYGPLTPEEISVFYKAFLDKYWMTHMWYNIEWYKQNLNLLALALKVELDRFRRKLFSHE